MNIFLLTLNILLENVLTAAAVHDMALQCEAIDAAMSLFYNSAILRESICNLGSDEPVARGIRELFRHSRDRNVPLPSFTIFAGTPEDLLHASDTIKSDPAGSSLLIIKNAQLNHLFKGFLNEDGKLRSLCVINSDWKLADLKVLFEPMDKGMLLLEVHQIEDSSNFQIRSLVESVSGIGWRLEGFITNKRFGPINAISLDQGLWKRKHTSEARAVPLQDHQSRILLNHAQVLLFRREGYSLQPVIYDGLIV